MAYLIDLGGGGKITLKAAVVVIDNHKRKVNLGRVTIDTGRRFCARLDELAGVRALNEAPGADLAKWLSGLSDSLRDRLTELGLGGAREDQESLTLGGMLDEVFKSLTVGHKPAWSTSKPVRLSKHASAKKLPSRRSVPLMPRSFAEALWMMNSPERRSPSG